ncbi:alpha/beta-hydrolase [Calocera cornea HHB12733]|uniref:Alpha/beta-hydrolase n=1 Tax=Calocera cornea HHB12733 TaxID=1353952 RepID=A0A165HDK9_9BASI|nr:alpha/beta-hydrolase [Calocera cornea HHB12733]
MSLLTRAPFAPTLRQSIPRAHLPPRACPQARRSIAHFKPGLLDLAFETFQPSVPEPGGPLIIVHGLFGSKQNWRSLMKLLGTALGRRVYTLDMRNHGTSPHNPKMDYVTMGEDILQFMLQHKIKKDVTLMGHSMGGKVVMALALNPQLEARLPGALARLISVDMSPAAGKLSDEFRGYIDAMEAVEAAQVNTKKQADPILEKWEKDVSVRQFLLTNLLPVKEKAVNQHAQFRIPLRFLHNAMDNIGSFPYPPDGGHTWPGRTLFIKGERSKYINKHNIPLLKTYFPNSTLETLDTGHWVHAEKPKEFVELVTQFIRADDKPPKEQAEGAEELGRDESESELEPEAEPGTGKEKQHTAETAA